jgi:AcrR family transcriptional regulator
MVTSEPTVRSARRGQPDGLSRRSELLAIAARLFAARGYRQTTVRDIADEAGILSGSLYHHFSSKEAMLDEIMRAFMGDLLNRFQTIVDGDGTPSRKLDELIRSSFETIRTHRDEVALYQHESSLLLAPKSGFEFVAESSRRIERLWLQVLHSGQESGDFRSELDPGLMHRFIRDTVWQTVSWYRPRGRLKTDAIAEQYLTLLHGGLLNG